MRRKRVKKLLFLEFAVAALTTRSAVRVLSHVETWTTLWARLLLALKRIT